MRLTALLLSLLLSLPLSSCAVPEDADPPADTSAPLSAAAGPASPEAESSGPAEEEEDLHTPAEESNILPHEPAGYCGNTVTTMRYTGGVGGVPEGSEEWEISFWGGPSVELTDLLRYLDYSGDICRCLPEYEVETEFSDTSYGVSLSAAYARHDGKQVSLTEEQVELIQGIIDYITAEGFDALED